MKTRFLLIALSLVTAVSFAQKKEIRNAGKAIEEGDYSEAISLLKQAEPQIAGEKDNVKADYYFAKGQAYLGAEDGENTSMEDLLIAVKAFQKAKDMGNTSADSGILAVRNALVNSAIADHNNEKYTEAADKLYKSYELGGKKDTLYLYYAASYLYYAASNEVTAKDYDKALKYYMELMDLGYDGAETTYTALDKETGEVRNFNSPKERDLFVKSGEYIKPETKLGPSKRGEIARNVALIYVQQDKPDMAIQAMKEAKAANPDDLGLRQVEANMYYKMGEIDTYNKLMKEIVKEDPENPVMYYNLAITSSQMGDDEGAIGYYKKAIKYDLEMENAYLNLAATILKEENGMVEAMNEALEKRNNKEYDRIANERKELYAEVLPYLEKAYQINQENENTIRTLMNIYYIMESPKADKMHAKLNALKQ